MIYFSLCSVSFPIIVNWKLLIEYVYIFPSPWCVSSATKLHHLSLSESSPLCEALKLSGLRKEFGSRSFLFCPENAFLWRYENLSQPTARLRQMLKKVQNSMTDTSQKMTILSNQIAGALGQRNPNVTYESFEFDKNRTEFRRILEQVSGTVWWQS